MPKHEIILYSKNKESLDSFFRFFQSNLRIQKIQEPLKYIRRKKEKRKISVLTSPHVNKTAQEQFEYTIYSIKFSFYSYRTKKCLILLKKIKNQLFPDIKIKIHLEGSVRYQKNFVRKILLNPNSFTFNLLTLNSANQQLNFKGLKASSQAKKNKDLLQKTSYYLEILNWSGT